MHTGTDTMTFTHTGIHHTYRQYTYTNAHSDKHIQIHTYIIHKEIHTHTQTQRHTKTHVHTYNVVSAHDINFLRINGSRPNVLETFLKSISYMASNK